MPGVIVQSSSSSTPLGFGSSHPDSSSPQNNVAPRSYDGLSVADIRQRAKDSVYKEAKGVPAISLIRTARTQIVTARVSEAKGDLPIALATYIRAATLTKMAMDSHEYSQENRGKGGAGIIRKELHDLFESEGRDITQRTNAVEDKIKAIEMTKSRPPGKSDSKSSPPVKSIKDRLRALQDSGLSIEQQTSKAARDLPTPPHSPRIHPPSLTPNSFPPPPSINPSTSSSAVNPNLTRALVSPSTLGPPSPSPSESPSRYLNSDDINGFNLAFPSLDELHSDPFFSLPSVPTAQPVSSNNATALKEKNGSQFLQSGDQRISPIPSLRNFTIPIERPSSTPLTPMNSAFASSRPPSPTITRTNHAPHKPSALSTGASPPTSRVNLPVTNTAFPKELSSYIKDYTVLFIDVRHRAEFDREHIKANAVVCVEPSILLRDGITAEALEHAMVVGPRQENSLFDNRDKFDLIAIYDSSSTTFGSDTTPISVLLRLIWEQAFKKMLKRMPMLLVGGIKAWKKEFGENQMIRNPGYAPEVEIQKPVPSKVYLAGVGNNIRNPFVNRPASPKASASMEVSSPPIGHDLSTAKSTAPVEQSGHARSPADAIYSGSYVSAPNGHLSRRPAIARPSPNSLSFSKSVNESAVSLVSGSHSTPNGSGLPPSVSPISYPQFPPRLSPTTSGSGSGSAPSPGLPLPTFSSHYDIASPPQASINPSQSSSRKRSDYVDQSQEALLNSLRSPTGTGAGTGSIGIGIDYPELNPSPLVRPPPIATPSLSERQDRPRRPHSYSTSALPSTVPDTLVNGPPTPPRINSDYPVRFWSDMQIGVSGLKNLGNTCYMNAPIQCLSATVPFARFFTDGRWKSGINYTNPLSSKGQLTGAFAKLLHEMWGGDLPYLTPIDFRRSICSLKAQYLGSDQHDSQEFLSFLIGGIHEDLNRVIVKPTHGPTPEEEAEMDMLPPQIRCEREWRAWKLTNDSLIVDYFQGQFRNRLECLTCHKTSMSFKDVFSILSLPIPNNRSGKVPIQRCLDAFFSEEVLEKENAWDCPRCKTKVRASKSLSLARLPPVLMIHLKRFEANGRFSDKVDTFVDFPMTGLDLTNYMPPPLPHGADRSGYASMSNDPRIQLPPYRYDLYGVTNHYGNLSSGHYTAFIASRGGWLYCDDSSVKPVDRRQVVNQKAYVLFYKRVRS